VRDGSPRGPQQRERVASARTRCAFPFGPNRRSHAPHHLPLARAARTRIPHAHSARASRTRIPHAHPAQPIPAAAPSRFTSAAVLLLLDAGLAFFPPRAVAGMGAVVSEWFLNARSLRAARRSLTEVRYPI